MLKIRTDNNCLFPAFMLVVFLTILMGRIASASGTPINKTAACMTAASSAVTEVRKEALENSAVVLDLQDFLAGDMGTSVCFPDFVEILGPVEHGRLFLQSVDSEGPAAPACLVGDLAAEGDGPEKASVTIQWPASPGAIDYQAITETCSSLYIPAGLFNIRDNLLFLPDSPFTGPVNIGFRLGTQTVGEGPVYSKQGTIVLDIIPGTARQVKQAALPSGQYPKDYTIKAAEGAIVQVGKTLKNLAGKTAARVRIVALPDSEVGVLRAGSVDVQSGEEILTSKLTSLYFSPSNNPDFFGDLTLEWLAITSAGVESDTATLTIRYTNVVDRPTTGDSAATIARDTEYTFTADDFTYLSKDNDSFNKLKIRSLPSSGTGRLEYNGVVMKSAGKTIDISPVKPFVFKPVEGKTGTTSFRFYVGSGSKFSKQSGNFVINIIESVVLTDAPVLFTTILTTTDTTPVWNWATLDKATGYEVSFDGSAWTDAGSKLSYTPEAELAPGEYTFHLRGKNSTGAGPEVTNTFTVLPPFTSSTPEFTETVIATIDTTPSWTWESLSGAVGYEVSLDGTTWIDRGTSQNYTQPSSSPLPVGSYTFYLRAYNTSASKSLVATSSFKIISDLSALTPTLTATVSSTSTIPSWSWTEVPGATSYETSFDNISWTDRGAGLSFTPDTQLTTGSHTFYLRAHNEASTSTHVEDAFVVFKDLPVNPNVTISDISVTESGNLTLAQRQHGSIDLSALFLDPDGYTVNLAEPDITCEDETAIIASISTNKSFDWVSDGIGKCTVTIQGTSGPEGNLKTGSKSFSIEIKPQTITLENVPNECGKTELDSFWPLYVKLSGIATSLLSDSQIYRMITITVLATSEGAIDPATLISKGAWIIPTTPSICTDTNCTRLDKIKVQYKLVDQEKLDHLEVKMDFGGVITTKLFDIVGRDNPANGACE